MTDAKTYEDFMVAFSDDRKKYVLCNYHDWFNAHEFAFRVPGIDPKYIELSYQVRENNKLNTINLYFPRIVTIHNGNHSEVERYTYQILTKLLSDVEDLFDEKTLFNSPIGDNAWAYKDSMHVGIPGIHTRYEDGMFIITIFKNQKSYIIRARNTVYVNPINLDDFAKEK